jgi:LuxR family maltose regulon positive regulatory protein
MTSRFQIILSQLTPPAQRSNVLARERVTGLLKQSLNYPLTVLVAGTGYGKSTSILSFIDTVDIPVFWYTVSATDRDPQVFLANLFTALNQHDSKLGQDALRMHEGSDVEMLDSLVVLVNTLSTQLNGPILFVLDDFHTVTQSSEVMRLMNWLIEHQPAHFHMLIASRTVPGFASMNQERVKGQVLEFGPEQLTFTPPEIRALFERAYQVKVADSEVQVLYDRTEGWAIVLQMIWQSLRTNPNVNLGKLLKDESYSRTHLFEYLAEEVLDQQTPEVQNFLLRTSILSFLESDLCDFLMDSQNSIDVLTELYRSSLFLEQLRPGFYRYHHIFRQFLQSHLLKNPELARELHRKVASYLTAHEYWERAIAHLLSAGDYRQVAMLLNDIGPRMVQSGRYESLRYWIDEIPDDVRAQHPWIYFLLGEIERYTNEFNQALDNYRAAQRAYQARNNKWGVSQALRGQAQVYLDTIRPVNASTLLEKALELLNPQESRTEIAELLTQLAENQVNQGLPDQAAESLRRSRELGAGNRINQDFIEARLMLRTGRLAEGIALLSGLESGSDLTSRPQRFHREASVLLSLFYCFNGEIERGLAYARKGDETAKELSSVFVHSVAQMRLGHALQLNEGEPRTHESFDHILNLYNESIKSVDIVRIHVEPLWGMCRLLGFEGQTDRARQVANEALAIANAAGDEWIGVLVRLSLGASLAVAGEFEAANEELTLAETGAKRVKDPLSQAAAHLWLAYTARKQGFVHSAAIWLEQAMKLVTRHGYDFLFTKPTMLGSSHPIDFVPLLVLAQQLNIETETTRRLLAELGVSEVSYHPGETLTINILGPFEVRVGRRLLEADVWKREKSRQLLQHLAAVNEVGLSRERIYSQLWPNVDPATATNHLKVVMNSLNQALEPDRPTGEPAFFIIRRQDLYLLNPSAQINLDYQHFESLCKSSAFEDHKEALGLYRGQFLEGEMTQEWYPSEEQYFHQLYLETSRRVIEQYIKEGKLERALDQAAEALKTDPLFEAGYVYQLKVYALLENPAMVTQVYRQARQVFARAYNDEPPEDLVRLYQRLSKG